MTDFYGVNATKRDVDVPSIKSGIGDDYGRIRCSYEKYTFAADVLATTDSLFMNKLPKGARIIDCFVECGDLGTTGILNIGIDGGANSLETADPDFFFAALDVKAAATKSKMLAGIAGAFHKLLDEVNLVVVPTEDTDAADTLTIEILVLYTVD